MSRGAGRIERSIEQILRNADRSFTVEELARLIYPNITGVSKAHRVSILRAINNVAKRMPLGSFRTHAPPWRLIVTNGANVRSYAHGLLRYSWWNAERSLEQIEKILNDREIMSLMEPGGLWWTEVEIYKVECENDMYWKAAEAAGLLPDPSFHCMAVSDQSPEMIDAGKQMYALRDYRWALAKDHSLHVLLGKFEPPGTPVFEYAMEHRAATADKIQYWADH